MHQGATSKFVSDSKAIPMKTKLLYLLSLLSFSLYAQIGVNVNFNNNIFPTGWTTNGYQLTSVGCLATGGMSKQHSQASPGGGFSTSNFISNGNAISFSVDYQVNSSNGGTVRVTTSYQINDGNFVIISNSASPETNGCVTLNFTIPAGTVPSGSQVKFNFEGFRQSLTTVLIYDNISILQSGSPTITLTNTTQSYNVATVNYLLNANGFTTTSIVKYGLSATTLSNQVVGTSTSGTTAVAGSGILTGLTPNTTYFYQVEATNTEGTVTSAIQSFTTQPQTPTITNISATSITSESATINYSLLGKDLPTTSLLRYGLTNTSLTQQLPGFSVSGSTSVAGNVTLSGLNPATTYFYQIEATNSAGTVTSGIGSFTTASLPSRIAYYPFNNSLNNSNGTNPFSAPNTTFVADRNNQAFLAVRVGSVTSPSSATIPNLPVANAERTISFWHKKPVHTSPVGLFAYGTNGNLQTFGIYLEASGNYVFQGFGTDHIFTSSATAANTWVHTVVTFKNGVIRLYNNGVLVGATTLNVNTGSSAFRLGGNQAVVDFDDLQVYDFELNATQVGELFTNNALSSENFDTSNLTVKLYPNPASEVLNFDVNQVVQSIEIFNVNGQKVLAVGNQTQVNVSNLAPGLYLVKILDVENNVMIRKVVIK